MQIQLFTVPALQGQTATIELNKFLRSHKILEVQQHFVPAANGAYWCFCVRYIINNTPNTATGKKEKIDYMQVLDKPVFDIFSKLRDLRKEISKNDAVPAYAVFTDEELSRIAQLPTINAENIKTIHGIGEKRTEKYGKLIAQMYTNETNRPPDTQNS